MLEEFMEKVLVKLDKQEEFSQKVLEKLDENEKVSPLVTQLSWTNHLKRLSGLSKTPENVHIEESMKN